MDIYSKERLKVNGRTVYFKFKLGLLVYERDERKGMKRVCFGRGCD